MHSENKGIICVNNQINTVVTVVSVWIYLLANKNEHASQFSIISQQSRCNLSSIFDELSYKQFRKN